MTDQPDIEAIAARHEADWESRRMELGWPTPAHMRRTADALDVLTPARYGDVLRWVADACDGVVDGSTQGQAERDGLALE